MGVISFLTVRFVEILVVLLLILFMPSIPPKANFTSFKVTPSQSLEGKLAINDRLNNAELLFKDELKGPEAFAEYNGNLYTSLKSGDVVKLTPKGHIVPVVKFGKPCTGETEESICGRPLGLRFDKNGMLYVADAYMGVWKVDVETGKKTLLVSMEQEIEGKKPMLPNAVAISENGDIYWTDSSSEFSLENGLFAMLADATGRLIHYDAKTKTNKVLLDNVHFANGVVLSENEEFVLVNDLARSRIVRYYLKGAKKGTHDIFIDGLPGLPDNLNSDGQGGFFVPLVITRDADHPLLPQIIGPFPWIRKLVARLLGLTELGFSTIHRMYPNMYTQMAMHWTGNFESVSFFVPSRSTVLHLSKTGEILNCLHGTDESAAGISEAFIYGNDMYFGSPWSTYVAKKPLSALGLGHLARTKREAPAKQAPPPTAAPVKQTPPPTPAPVKKTPPPTAAPTQKTPPPTAVPVKQTPPPPTKAPVKETATKQTAPPPAQAPPANKQVPVKQAPPPTAAPVKQAPPPAQQAPPVKQKPTPTPAPAKQTPPPAQTKPKEPEKVVPVKENTVPKSEPVKPRN